DLTQGFITKVKNSGMTKIGRISMIDKTAKFIGAFTIYALWVLVIIFVLGIIIKGIWWTWSNIF
ncbi:hypothetical protein KC280_15420, partial [Listeria monocytogenes]|uniref:hypothetical protein n=1 Tax=Listeria monocytogenes TaxID=1639 RepID=UPI001F562418